MASFREMTLAVYKNQPVESVPIGVYSRYLPRGSVEREAREAGFGILEYVPVVSMAGPPWHLLDGFLSPSANVEISARYLWLDEHWVQRRTYETPVGSVYQEMEADSAGAGSEHIRKHYIQNSEDYKILTYIVENARILGNEGAIRRHKEHLGNDGVVLGRMDRSPYQKCMIELAGPERFLLDLHTCPEPVLELMSALRSKLIESAHLAAESTVDVLWLPENVTSDLTPPASFSEFHLPLYKELSQISHAAGKQLLAHMDGKIKALCPMIEASDLDAVESMSLRDIGGDLNLSDAYGALPGRVIIPNIPTNWCLLEDQQIFNRLEGLLLERKKGRPFMIQVSEDVPETHWNRFIGVISSWARRRPR